MTPDYKINDIVKLTHKYYYGVVLIESITTNKSGTVMYNYKVLSGNPAKTDGKYKFYEGSHYAREGRILGSDNKLTRLFFL